MKKIQIKSHVSNMAFGYATEDYIKDVLTRKLAEQIADNFFKDLKLKKSANDAINAIEYVYSFCVLEVGDYRNIMHKLHNLIKYAQTKRSDDQLLYLLVDLKNEMLKETT